MPWLIPLVALWIIHNNNDGNASYDGDFDPVIGIIMSISLFFLAAICIFAGIEMLEIDRTFTVIQVSPLPDYFMIGIGVLSGLFGLVFLVLSVCDLVSGEDESDEQNQQEKQAQQ